MLRTVHATKGEFTGVEVHQKLNWQDDIERICKKASTGIGAIRRLKPFVPAFSLVSPYKALVQLSSFELPESLYQVRSADVLKQLK